MPRARRRSDEQITPPPESLDDQLARLQTEAKAGKQMAHATTATHPADIAALSTEEALIAPLYMSPDQLERFSGAMGYMAYHQGFAHQLAKAVDLDSTETPQEQVERLRTEYAAGEQMANPAVTLSEEELASLQSEQVVTAPLGLAADEVESFSGAMGCMAFNRGFASALVRNAMLETEDIDANTVLPDDTLERERALQEAEYQAGKLMVHPMAIVSQSDLADLGTLVGAFAPKSPAEIQERFSGDQALVDAFLKGVADQLAMQIDEEEQYEA